MTTALRALLAGAIDYAGMFPPASWPLPAAMKLNREYHRRPEAWMLGRFVWPAEKLSRNGLYNRELDGPITAIAVPYATLSEFSWSVDETLAKITAFPITRAIDAVEFRWPEPFADIFMVDAIVIANKVRHAMSAPATMYFECVPGDLALADNDWRTNLSARVEALVEHRVVFDSLDVKVGLKFRTGGTSPAAVPPSWQLATVITACRDAGVFWKATAGLHHPFRQHDPGLGTRTHGFLNVLVAAVLADVHGLSTGQVQGILGDEDPEHFRFADDTLTLREWSVTSEQIAAARQRGLRSFGSCSFEEPVQDLKRLGLL